MNRLSNLAPRRYALALLAAVLLFPFAAGAEDALLIAHGPRTQAKVALTFDLCQVPKHPAGFDRGVIDTLRRTSTPATFFVGGDWLRTHQQEGEELAGEPLFELGNHSWSHPDLRKLDDAAIRDEIARTEELLQQRIGRTPHLFRLPFGYYDQRALRSVAQNGMRIIQWDVVSGDPDRSVSAAQMIKGVIAEVRNGSIIVMHANGRGHHTAEALPEIIRQLRARGLTPVTVSELLAEK